jgi:N-dimethylarginine dimethylaminohydrolase|tara:strand:+ start:845 stop:1063 length:219 start_codon:yes stop_codon:yes gene_type:complete
MKKTRKRRIARSSDTAHQRIDDHEKLCRIMQRETHKKIEANGKKIERLEKVVFTSTGMLIVGMATLIYGLIV